LKLHFDSEDALVRAAGSAAAAWRRDGIGSLLIGLGGDLGVGKTTFARALLRGLGYVGRVPSPTYTLLEHYDLDGLTVVHLDLYRLSQPHDLDYLGLRDFLALPTVWVVAEWPERGGAFRDSLDLLLTLTIEGDETRSMTVSAPTAAGQAARSAWLDRDIK